MLGRKVALGAALLAGLQLVMRFVDMITLVIMARLLTPADFGIVALAASVMLIVGAATELSVAEVLVQRQTIEPEDVDTAFTLNWLRGVVAMLAIAALSLPMAVLYEDARLTVILCVMSLIPFVNGLTSPALVHYLHQLEYGPNARMQIFGRLGGILVSVSIAFTTGSYWALIASQLAAQAISTLYSYYIAPYRPKFRLEGARSILHFAGWVTASRIISTLNLQSDRFFVGYLLGKSQLGQYTVGSDISAMTTYALAGPIMQTMFGGFSRLQGDRERIRNAYLKGQQMLVFVVLPFGFGISVTAELIMPLLLGPNWDFAIAAVRWMACVAALQVLYLPLLSLSMAMAQPRLLALRETVNLAIRLPVTLGGAWYFGFMGAILGRSVSALVVIFLTLMIARRFIQISVLRQITNVWRTLVSVVVMAVVVELAKVGMGTQAGSLAQVVEIAALVGLGGLVYLGTHLGLWLAAGRPDGAEQFIVNLLRTRGRG